MVSILGNRVRRIEDPRLLTVGGTYVEDVALEGAAWLTYVRSPHAHARITGIDVTAASASPGVLAVFTADDLAELGLAPHTNPQFPAGMRRPYLAADTVRYVGQPIVAIVAEDRACGSDAADLVIVDVEPLPAVVDPEAAVHDDVLLVPRGRLQRGHPVRLQAAGRLQRLRGRRRRADRQPAHDGSPDRGSLRRRLLDRRGTARALLGVSGSAPDTATCWPRCTASIRAPCG